MIAAWLRRSCPTCRKNRPAMSDRVHVVKAMAASPKRRGHRSTWRMRASSARTSELWTVPFARRFAPSWRSSLERGTRAEALFFLLAWSYRDEPAGDRPRRKRTKAFGAGPRAKNLGKGKVVPQ